AAFGFRAPVEVWRKFLSATPPPLYHDFFAMLMRVPEFVIEGDSFLAMQNARALHRMMNLMRGTEAGGGRIRADCRPLSAREVRRRRLSDFARRGGRRRSAPVPAHRRRRQPPIPPSA